jgi:hypothetical protein
LDIGHGKDMPLVYRFIVPQHMLCQPTVNDLVSTIYPSIHLVRQLTDQYFLEYAILCPQNSEVDEIKDILFEKFPDIGTTYNPEDSVPKEPDDVNLYPGEYLNSVNFGGLPQAN